MIRSLRASAIALACLFALGCLLSATAACAQTANRAWVSGRGTDAAGCGAPTAPCRSLQYAHDHIVAAGGEIDILDPAGYGAVTITKSISIVNDGVGTAGVQSVGGLNAINVNAGGSDSVYLRGLSIDGVGRRGEDGIQFNSGEFLTIANCIVRDFFNAGISLSPTDLAQVTISDTVTSDIPGGFGVIDIDVARMTINHLTASNDSSGVAVRSDGSIVVLHDVFAANNLTGISVSAHSASAANVHIDGSVLAENQVGLDLDPVYFVRLSNSLVFGNGTGIEAESPSSLYTFANNEIDANGTDIDTVNVTLHSQALR